MARLGCPTTRLRDAKAKITRKMRQLMLKHKNAASKLHSKARAHEAAANKARQLIRETKAIRYGRR